MIETRQVALGPLTLTVDMAGPKDGEAVLLLHGFPETRHMWRHQLQALSSAGYRAIAPDQRGYSTGARPSDEAAYATNLIVADALQLMETLGHTRYHLVGHDWGGQISWLVATSHPERLRSLTIFSRPHPEAFIRAMKEDTAQAARSGHHRAFREPDAVARMRAADLKPLRAALRDQGVPDADANVYMSALLEPGAIEAAMNWYRAGSLSAASVPAISVPTLYVWGKVDATVGRFAAAHTAEYDTGPYRFVEMDNAGHFLIDQFPGECSALLVEHLKSN